MRYRYHCVTKITSDLGRAQNQLQGEAYKGADNEAHISLLRVLLHMAAERQ